MKEKLKVLGLAAGIYTGVYAAGEVVHHANCQRDEIHNVFSDDHMSAQWHAENEKRRVASLESAREIENTAEEMELIWSDIHQTMDEITFKVEAIHDLVKALDAQAE